jgi:hypothetical protein
MAYKTARCTWIVYVDAIQLLLFEFLGLENIWMPSQLTTLKLQKNAQFFELFSSRNYWGETIKHKASDVFLFRVDIDVRVFENYTS